MAENLTTKQAFERFYNNLDGMASASMPVGSIIPYIGSGIPSGGWFLCNGGQMSKTAYPELFSVIGYDYGGEGDTFYLPDLTGRFLEGSNVAGEKKEAGLPNIEGSSYVAVYGSGATTSGSLNPTSGGNTYLLQKGDYYGTYNFKLNFDASQGGTDPIFGKSDTVQPASITVRYIIKAVSGKSQVVDANLDSQVALNTENIAKSRGSSNVNLLMNPWFTVNQRGASAYTSTSNSGFSVDRWHVGTSLSVASDGVTIPSGGYIYQVCEDSIYASLVGKTVMASVLFGDGSIKYGYTTIPSTIGEFTYHEDSDVQIYGIKSSNANGSQLLGVYSKGTQLTIKAVKLELGTVSTLAFDSAPDYASELAKCQYYFQKYSYKPATIVSWFSSRSAYAVFNFPKMRSVPNIENLTIYGYQQGSSSVPTTSYSKVISRDDSFYIQPTFPTDVDTRVGGVTLGGMELNADL